MSDLKENIPLRMRREHLSNLPLLLPRNGYSIRWFRPGDEANWAQIQSEADYFNRITRNLFQSQFGGAGESLGQRICFLEDAQHRPIGTGAAWFVERPDSPMGRIHWLAVLPEAQGRGHGQTLLSVLCQRLRELGHRQVFLKTASARILAIRLYLKFGFTPWPSGADEEAVWSRLLKQPEFQR